MVSVITRDGKRQNRTLDINGFVKPSGTIVASVTNDKGETYFVQVRTNGTHTCKHIVNGKRVSCLGHFHTGRCYHVDAVIAALLPSFEEINAVSNATQIIETVTTRRSTTPVDLYIVRQFKAADAYEQLAETKDPWAGLSEDEKVTAMGYYLMGISA